MIELTHFEENCPCCPIVEKGDDNNGNLIVHRSWCNPPEKPDEDQPFIKVVVTTAGWQAIAGNDLRYALYGIGDNPESAVQDLFTYQRSHNQSKKIW